MTNQSNLAESDPDEIDIRDLIRTLWDGRWVIIACTVLCSVAAIIYALLLTPIYRSQALVQVREESAGGGLSALSQQLGGLADIAGISTGGGGNRAVSIAVLQSRALISAYIEEHKLLSRLYSDHWDAGNSTWNVSDPKNIPTLWNAYNLFKKNILRVSEDKKTGLVTVSVEWENPLEAQQWVAGLIARTNRHLQAKAIQEAETNLAYLQSQVEQTSLVPLQQALYTLLESEQKKLMVAKGSEEFALQTIDAADVPERKIKPNRALIAIVGFMLGGMIGTILVMVRKSFSNT